MYRYTALVTLLSLLFYFYTTTRVSSSHRIGVKVPAISGNPDFERVFRMQMNTLEWLPIFLPSLWLFAIYISDAIAAGIGVVWITGRIVYLIGYAQAAAKRGPGFGIQATGRGRAAGSGALGAIVWRIVHGELVSRRSRPLRRDLVETGDTQCRRRFRCMGPGSPGRHLRVYFVSGQPLSLAVKNAWSPGTTASCL